MPHHLIYIYIYIYIYIKPSLDWECRKWLEFCQFSLATVWWKATGKCWTSLGIEPMMLGLPGKYTTDVATDVLPKQLTSQANHQLDWHQLWDLLINCGTCSSTVGHVHHKLWDPFINCGTCSSTVVLGPVAGVKCLFYPVLGRRSLWITYQKSSDHAEPSPCSREGVLNTAKLLNIPRHSLEKGVPLHVYLSISCLHCWRLDRASSRSTYELVSPINPWHCQAGGWLVVLVFWTAHQQQLWLCTCLEDLASWVQLLVNPDIEHCLLSNNRL